MKKKIVSVLIAATVICGCLAGCGSSEKESEEVIDFISVTKETLDGEPVTEAEESKDTEVSDIEVSDMEVSDTETPDGNQETAEGTDFDYDAQVQFVFDHSRWLSNNERVTYTFSDLDHNGRMEVIVCEKSEDGEAAPLKFYEVSFDDQDVKECSYETNCYIYALDQSSCEAAYVDSETGKYSYLMKYEEDYEGEKLFYYYELELNNGGISQYAVCSQNPMGYYDFRFEKIEEDQFEVEKEISNYFEGKTEVQAPKFLFDSLEGDGMKGKISNSIHSFLN